MKFRAGKKLQGGSEIIEKNGIKNLRSTSEKSFTGPAPEKLNCNCFVKLLHRVYIDNR